MLYEFSLIRQILPRFERARSQNPARPASSLSSRDKRNNTKSRSTPTLSYGGCNPPPQAKAARPQRVRPSLSSRSRPLRDLATNQTRLINADRSEFRNPTRRELDIVRDDLLILPGREGPLATARSLAHTGQIGDYVVRLVLRAYSAAAMPRTNQRPRWTSVLRQVFAAERKCPP